jgi:hypothetical protein
VRPEGRAHHVAGGLIPIRVAVDRVVEDQVLREHLAERDLALEPGPRQRLEGVDAAGVHEVERRAEHLGDAQGAVGGLAFDLRRPRQRVALRAVDTLVVDGLLQPIDQLAVLGMHGAQRAELARAHEAVHQHLVIAHDGVLVRHEVLERVDAALGRQHAHVAVHRLVPPGDGDVEAVVAGRLLGPLAPRVVGLDDRLARARDGEIDDGRRAAGHRRGGAGEEVLGRHRAHEGQLHMRVRVDAAGQHEGARGVDDVGPSGRFEVGADRRDGLADDQDVGLPLALRVDDGAAFDEGRRHRLLLVLSLV